MDTPVDARSADAGRWVTWTGAGAVVGTVLWFAMPWFALVRFGTRPYVATGFDVGSFVGWLLMAGGLVGAWFRFGGRLGRAGRFGFGLTAVGMVLVAGLLGRRVVVFVGAGFRAVPATGEDPAGLLLTWAFLLGFGLVFVGVGLLGVGLRRLAASPPLTASVLAVTPLLTTLLVGLRFLSALPLSFGTALVRTNLAFLPLTVGWVLLGRLVATRGSG
ncbi:hypothetical protein C2R22_18440 [Salinigranum rubrum]|uniref:DUF998 domain-containing protein n=1 Tax=Salinigranum rubrum TaxID=755307 RepID=A0A2I8VN81_9EURY|nr:hypothetical protein [Salinigranum rubrum]AUV83378.1 hypothetical protein C2R22_18440 [Salinigranum rubrum]